MPKFTFPIWLQGSPEQQAAENERQALALALHARGHLSDAERLAGRGALLEKTAQANLDAADSDETRFLACAQLADAMAMQGKYTEACETHPDPARKLYFENVVKAIEMPDDERCMCKDARVKVGETELAITPRFELEKILSPLHHGIVSVVCCSKCGDLNARPLAGRLIAQQGALNENERGKGRPLTDAQILHADPV